MALTAEESVEELTEQLVLNGRLNKAINIWFPQFGYCTENIMCVCVNVQILVSDYNYGQEWKQSTAVIFRKMIKHMRKLLKSKRYWHWNAKTVGVAGRWYLSAPTVTPLSLFLFFLSNYSAPQSFIVPACNRICPGQLDLCTSGRLCSFVYPSYAKRKHNCSHRVEVIILTNHLAPFSTALNILSTKLEEPGCFSWRSVMTK